MFSLRFTLLLLAILIIPCLVRLKYGFETYPTMMLPSGAHRVQVGSDKYTVSYTALYAKNQDESWDRVDTRRLLHPIPSGYQKYIFARNFGLEDQAAPLKSGNLPTALRKLSLIKNREITEQDKEEVKAWLKGKLQEQGFADNELKIIQKEEVISIPAGENLSENTKDEKIIYLD